MKKGIFLPMLAIILLIIIGTLGMIFYGDILKSKNEVVGEKSAEVINFITESELNYFYIKDSARLAWCDSLVDMSSGKNIPCIYNDYPIWDIGINKNEECDPADYKRRFNAYFKDNFEKYLSRKNISFEYDLDVNNKKILPKNNVEFEKQIGKLSIQSRQNPIVNIELLDNFDDFEVLLYCIYKEGREECLKEIGAKAVFSDENAKIYEYKSIKNPCDLKDINIVFGIEKTLAS